STDEEFDSDFGALVRGSTLWFPCDFEFTFQCDDLSDETIVVGSTRQLSAQLFDLNARTWKADEKTIAEWRRNCPPADAPLELGARYAFSIMLDLARKATEQRLVMKLDY
ncbi:MAG: hypothetical protein KDA33_01750, partial [Phycisphaerales bacterium]|nr:hypothetical protein [Phycisphaerales bacterium]